MVGKTLGVFGASVIAVRLGIGRLPTDTTWRHVFGLALCAGIGFTVALFVTSISLTDPQLADSAKVGILFGSLAAGVMGYAFLRTASGEVRAECPEVPGGRAALAPPMAPHDVKQVETGETRDPCTDPLTGAPPLTASATPP